MANTAVYGIYSTRQDAEMAIDAMRAAGFRPGDISVLFPDNQGTKDIGHEKHTKAPEKATAGAAIAGVAGGTIGWLAGIGALAIPGIGPFVAAGPIMAALAGLGAGSIVGGLTGALIGAGIPEYEAKRYEGRIRNGGILLSVHCEDNHMVARAKEMLRHTGAEDVASAEEARVPAASRKTLEREHTYEDRPVAAVPPPVPETRVRDDRRVEDLVREDQERLIDDPLPGDRRTVVVEDRRGIDPADRPRSEAPRFIPDEPLAHPLEDTVRVERRPTDSRSIDPDRPLDVDDRSQTTRRVVHHEEEPLVRDGEETTEEELRRRLDPPGRTELL